MQIALADTTYAPQIVSFFKNNLDCNNSGIYSEEFLCPLGIKAAIRRKQMMVGIVDGQVVGAFRFYRKKTSNSLSREGLLKKMLKTINDLPVLELCPIESNSMNSFTRQVGIYKNKMQNLKFGLLTTKKHWESIIMRD
jgi:diaminopimelate decarboxylase